MKDEYEHYLIIDGIIGLSVIVMASLYLYYHFKIQLMTVITSTLVLLYLFTITAFSIRTFFLIVLTRIAKKLHFRIITDFFEQPKLNGTYRHHSWQFHFREKETGKFPGVLRTYVKLIFKEKKKFDAKKLAELGEKVAGAKIIVIKHVVKKDKNYLLMKVSGFIFSTRKLRYLMDELLAISEHAEKN